MVRNISYNQGGTFQITGPEVGQSVYVRVVLTNDCGEQFEYGQSVYGASEVDGLPCQLARQSSVLCTDAYPNPADAVLSIAQAAGATTTTNNSQGKLMYTARKGRHTATVDTRSWPAGLYYLHTQTGKSTTRCRVQVEHR